MYRLYLLISLGFITLFYMPLNGFSKQFNFEYQKVIKTDNSIELELSYISGGLIVLQSNEDKVIIEAVKRVNAVSMDEAEIVADHIEIKTIHDNNRITISANYLRMRNRGRSFWKKVLGIGGDDSFGEIDWIIHLPEGSKLSVVNTSGNMAISHLAGDLNIRTSSAEIDLQSIEGEISIENSFGITRGELLFGPISLRQAQGKIDLRFVEGDIRIKSSSADISVRQDRGSLDLTTSSGHVMIQTNLDSSRDYFVETESGDIKLSIPETSSGNIRIESQTGEIQTDIPIAIESMSRRQVEGKFGAGGVKINLVSISGDVTVAQF